LQLSKVQEPLFADHSYELTFYSVFIDRSPYTDGQTRCSSVHLT